MTARRPCPPAPGPLEDYANQFDPLLASVAQRRGFRDYLQGLLLPRDRNKTLTGLAGAEPITGAQHRQVQRLQWFLSESAWDHEVVNDRRVRLLCEDPATAPHDRGVLVLDDTGDRKDGTATAHVARQYLGSVGKIDNGIVAVTSLWADERVYWPVHAVPYTPASRLPGGERDPGFRTKPQLAVELVQAARQAGIAFQAVVADCFYGDNPGFTNALVAAKVPFVLALKPRRAAGRRPSRPTRRSRRLGNLAGAARTGLGSGGASSGASATATAKLGGRLMGSLAAGARSGGCGWWWPAPTRPASPGTAAGIC
jgi:SRSO17 transposase